MIVSVIILSGNMNINDDHIKAKVTEWVDYNVEIDLAGEVVSELKMKCSCPYSKSGNNCKHMAAVMLTWEQSKPSQKPVDSTMEERPRVIVQKKKPRMVTQEEKQRTVTQEREQKSIAQEEQARKAAQEEKQKTITQEEQVRMAAQEEKQKTIAQEEKQRMAAPEINSEAVVSEGNTEIIAQEENLKTATQAENHEMPDKMKNSLEISCEIDDVLTYAIVHNGTHIVRDICIINTSEEDMDQFEAHEIQGG